MSDTVRNCDCPGSEDERNTYVMFACEAWGCSFKDISLACCGEDPDIGAASIRDARETANKPRIMAECLIFSGP